MKNVVIARRISILSLSVCALLVPTFSVNAAVPPALIEQNGPTLAPMLKKVMPTVVNIVATSEAQMARNPLMDDPFFRHFFDMPQQPQRRPNSSIGSGVIVDAAKGIVLTNDHVVANADSITVRLSDDREVEAELVGSDPETDIAVLKIKAKNLKALPIGDSQNLQVGDFVVAVGNPFGLRQTVTSGIVSGLGRSGLGKRYENFIQTDASINPGNSGGALIDLKGRLVGINTAILSRGGGNIGIGFAIPVHQASTVMAQILEHGEVQRGRLGVVGQDLDKDLAKAFGLERTRGVVVAQVIADSPADKAGVKSGDVITQVNDHEIRDFGQLRNAIGSLKIGDKARIVLLREGKAKTLTAKIAAAPEAEVTASDELHEGLTGATFIELDENHPLAASVKAGVVVKTVQPGSPAGNYGLRPGDIITSLNRQPIESLAAFRKAAKGKGRLLLHLRRGNGAMFILIR